MSVANVLCHEFDENSHERTLDPAVCANTRPNFDSHHPRDELPEEMHFELDLSSSTDTVPLHFCKDTKEDIPEN
jgi:hypothetical protein